MEALWRHGQRIHVAEGAFQSGHLVRVERHLSEVGVEERVSMLPEDVMDFLK